MNHQHQLSPKPLILEERLMCDSEREIEKKIRECLLFALSLRIYKITSKVLIFINLTQEELLFCRLM